MNQRPKNHPLWIRPKPKSLQPQNFRNLPSLDSMLRIGKKKRKRKRKMAMLPSPLNIARSDFLSPNSYLHFFPSKPTCRFRNRSLIITFSYKPRNEIDGNDKKREFLEQYGLNPDEFLSKPSTKIKRKRDQGNTGMRNVTHSETKEPKKERGRGERGMKG